jgi:peptidoglycan hydrolase-like protein with peptidoglycan-binding domain
MGVSAKAVLLLSPLAAALLLAAPATARIGSSDVAALQVALRAKGLYGGDVDGIAGPQTTRGVRVLQRRARLPVDGVVGPRTRSALGRFGRHELGRRILRRGMSGWDVAELQFLLAWHGFPSGPFDGTLGRRTEAALIRFQRWAGLLADGLAGPSSTSVLRAPAPISPISLSMPVAAPVGDVFGPRGARFHAGVDFPAPFGTTVVAAAAGRVTYAGLLPGGWGNVVSVAHGTGVRTTYAHLSRIDVRVGERVAGGARVGLVGSTGNSTGPHLHFEVRLRGALVDPLSALR